MLKFLRFFLPCIFCFVPSLAFADFGIVDSLNLAPLVPIVLDALMTVAQGGYEFFVGNGDGIIYMIVWGWLAVFVALYLIKMYFPQNWLKFFGLGDGGQVWDGKASGFNTAYDLLKPIIRAVIAVTLFLQIKPVYVTDWIVDPFLRFGAIYTSGLTESMTEQGLIPASEAVPCPASIEKTGWLTTDACKFLVQPVYYISAANNTVIKRGLSFVMNGITGLLTPIPNGGQDFLKIITGILLIFTFVSSNFFMALLIIQGIFNFGMALIMYPFKVLAFVVKKSDKWVDPWPAFQGIVDSLRELVITMIACAFILIINLAIIKSLINWESFNNDAAIINFGQHSVVWLSTILTFYLMIRIFNLTKDQLNNYVGKNMGELNKNVMADASSMRKNLANFGTGVGKALGWIKN